MAPQADLYLRLHDDGATIPVTTPVRRVGALVLALLILATVPLMWASADALAGTAPKAGVVTAQDDDDSGPGGDDDQDDDTGKTGDDTATRSRDATNTGDTGVSTKPQTATQSRDETRTKNTGVSTAGSR
jgi:hypothetical protein